MKQSKIYDVAISFAEEDVSIAQAIRDALVALDLEVYFYKDEQAENWGENLFNIIVNRYSEASRFSLLIISESYKQKWWTKIEAQIVTAAAQKTGSVYLLPLLVDCDGFDDLAINTLHQTWKNNPEAIANDIRIKVQAAKAKEASELEEKAKEPGTSNNQNSYGDNSANIGNIGHIGIFNLNSGNQKS